MIRDSGDVSKAAAGYLISSNRLTGQEVPFEVEVNTHFFIGRDCNQCLILINDITVSNKHLEIYAIGYEEGSCSDVDPLVYAQNLSVNGTLLKRAPAVAAEGDKRERLRMGTGAVLLSEGDELHLNSEIFFTYIARDSQQVRTSTGHKTQQTEKKAIEHLYTITSRKLGTGGCGNVYLAFDRMSSRQLACKIVDLEYEQRHEATNIGNTSRNRLRRLSAASQPKYADTHGMNGIKINHIKIVSNNRIEKLLREVEVLQSLNHPNIVGLEKVFWSESTLYIFEELITAGDLFSYLEFHGGALPDISTAVIMRQILKAVEYLHDHDVVHRDLKPQNILMTSLNEGARVVVTDFGHARFLHNDGPNNSMRISCRMMSVVGTFEWSAPEIHGKNRMMTTNGYSKAVDMWSIGAITAAVLTGYSLFSCPDDADDDHIRGPAMIARAGQCNLEELESGSSWQRVGRRPKDFIKKLLVLDENARMTARKALQHAWFTNKYHAQEFDLLYQRAVGGWKPRSLPHNLIERLSLPTLDSTFSAKMDNNRPVSYHKHALDKNCSQFASVDSESARQCPAYNFNSTADEPITQCLITRLSQEAKGHANCTAAPGNLIACCEGQDFNYSDALDSRPYEDCDYPCHSNYKDNLREAAAAEKEKKGCHASYNTSFDRLCIPETPPSPVISLRESFI